MRTIIRAAADKVCRICGRYASNGYMCTQCMRGKR